MRILRVLNVLIISAALIALTGFTSYAEENDPQLLKMRATAYCLQGTTYTGKQVREGICATGNKALVGKTVVLYQRLPDDGIGDYIGTYEVEDTGCNEHVIDVWCEDLEKCQEFMNEVYTENCKGKIWVLVVSATG